LFAKDNFFGALIVQLYVRKGGGGDYLERARRWYMLDVPVVVCQGYIMYQMWEVVLSKNVRISELFIVV